MRLHQEMKKVIEERKDIAFYIKMCPLKIHPEAYEKAKIIVCERSLVLLKDAFEKRPLPRLKCETTVVDENIRLAEKLGISSVPSLILPDGRIISGFRNAETILGLIGR